MSQDNCCCKSAKSDKRDRVFDILNILTGDYLYDVPESQLSETINRLRQEGWTVQDLKITEEVFLKPVWVIVE